VNVAVGHYVWGEHAAGFLSTPNRLTHIVGDQYRMRYDTA
jgi:hypothetical protein